MGTDEKLEMINSTAIEPWERLGNALTKQKAIEASGSEEAAEGARLAADIVRMAGDLGLDSRDLSRRSREWTLLVSAADSGRSRLLSSAAKRTKLAAAACFEADGSGGYRFLNNRIVIDHPALGKSDLLSTAAESIKFMIAELSLESDWAAEKPEGPAVFKPAVVLDAGPNKDRVFKGLQIQFYKRDPSGELATYQPKDWQLELKTSV